MAIYSVLKERTYFLRMSSTLWHLSCVFKKAIYDSIALVGSNLIMHYVDVGNRFYHHALTTTLPLLYSGFFV